MEDYIICTPVMLSTTGKGVIKYQSAFNNFYLEPYPLYEPQHLYLVSEREIKKGNWYYSKFDYKLVKAWNAPVLGHLMYKVEATTNKSLSLPLIPSSFIKRWVNEKGNIDKVKLKMDYGEVQLSFHSPSFLQVIIFPVEEKTYNREEVKEISKTAYKTFAGLPSEFDEWFDKNYPI